MIISTTGNMTGSGINLDLAPEARRKAFLKVSGLAVDTQSPCSAAHNTSTIDGKFSYKLSDADATTSVSLARWAAISSLTKRVIVSKRLDTQEASNGSSGKGLASKSLQCCSDRPLLVLNELGAPESYEAVDTRRIRNPLFSKRTFLPFGRTFDAILRLCLQALLHVRSIDRPHPEKPIPAQ